ncbi:hypothetical protein GCK72_020199 [Caenorhabditis remanei]|uniref:Seven TM Receptor n=1 Tax=Caenorhabditis remanei TaxID=31234 RepID=A0A6A5GGL5_CAERE|nr:hypothetical protein GCK72_020199 [Caenorhabditis remanei]KAF1753642.1 hypothetical protein GCK72_020199 [Caenorhabditis remanei]
MLKIPMLANYDEDSAEIMFAAGLYWSTDGKGERHWCIRDCLASLGLTMLMGICCSTILYCGIKTYQKMREMKDSLSKQTAALNNQLFLTLILQTVLPFALMYAPVGLLFFLPLFEINLGFLASSAAGSTAIYPALEPLIAIFCINLFRNTVLCRKKKISTVYDLSSTVAPA